ncbi:ADP-ribosylglycohydrolase family protein [Nocardia sp. NPDC050793]|uniref:ADP-ribosylglycohydrolase family protein n=1 Tax=Nocardia sp. NPDC050793 TaxID=3155159 RepID=UPI0033DDDCC2
MDPTIEAVFYGRHEADPRALLYFEWRQRLESGHLVARFESAVRALATADPADADACSALREEIESAPFDPEWGFDEGELADAASLGSGAGAASTGSASGGGAPTGSWPADPAGRASSTGFSSGSGAGGEATAPGRGAEHSTARTAFDSASADSASAGPAASDSTVPDAAATTSAPDDELLDRIHGGWLGRCVGCTLGKPLENGFVWTREHIRTYLERVDAYPLTGYVPVVLPPPFPLNPTWPVSTRGRIDGAPRDDDIDYTVLGLHLLESRGLNFTPEDVANLWLERLPFLQTYTAERVAYRNLVDGLRPPATATVRNPYREWIGAMIRADIFGYVNPGNPQRAAALAAREAAVSHTGNGIFAAMWAAALIAAAFTASGPSAALTVAQDMLPPRSRLAVALAEVRADHDQALSWKQALHNIETRHGAYNWVHAIPNACRVAAGLLWGAGDFTRTIALTVQSGADTDSNGATAGSVAGILVGAERMPAHWTDPFHDTLHSAVMGYDGVRISDLARRTRVLV